VLALWVASHSLSIRQHAGHPRQGWVSSGLSSSHVVHRLRRRDVQIKGLARAARPDTIKHKPAEY
jgi:hypothetical protein